mgnify:FL=1
MGHSPINRPLGSDYRSRGFPCSASLGGVDEMTAIGPGDWVECVGYALGKRGFEPRGPTPKKGEIYQIEAVVMGRLRDGAVEPAYRLVGWHVPSETGARIVYHHSGFRPIYRPKADLIERLMQPVKVKA